jgi:hypothetical protein
MLVAFVCAISMPMLWRSSTYGCLPWSVTVLCRSTFRTTVSISERGRSKLVLPNLFEGLAEFASHPTVMVLSQRVAGG